MTAVALADARAQMAEEALSLSGSLNVRRTVVSLITLFRPRLADWATLVMPDSVTGGLVLFGGNDASFSTVVARDSVAGPGLDRVLRTGRTELRVAAEAVPADELSSMIPYPELRAEAVELRPGAVLGLGLTARNHTWGPGDRPWPRARFRRRRGRLRRAHRVTRCDGTCFRADV